MVTYKYRKFHEDPVIRDIQKETEDNFVDKTETTIYTLVSEAFHDPVYVIIYVFAVVVAAVHVSHGFWSAFQSMGANHPKYMPLVRMIGLAFSLIVGIGFGALPVYLFFIV